MTITPLPPYIHRKPAQRRQPHHIFRLGLLIFIFIASAIVLPLLHHFLQNSSFCQIQTITINPLGQHVTLQEMHTYLAPYIGKSMYALNMDAVSAKAKQHPWVKTIAVRRFPPHELYIDFSEHVPMALVSLPKLYLVDDEGIIFKPLSKESALTLPIITGITKENFLKDEIQTKQRIQNAIVALRQHRIANSPGGKIAEIHINSVSRITVQFQNGLEVMLGKDHFEEKWLKLLQILSQLRDKKADLEYAYLDDYPHTHQVAIRLKKVLL